MISTIKDKHALAILVVDLLDLPLSIWPGLKDILGVKRPIFVVGNKIDLLPKDKRGYLNHIQDCLKTRILNSGFSESNIKHICLISATTGYGIESLITQLHNKWGPKGDVYLVGSTNVGKSSLFNSLLRSDFCKVQASNLVQKATACPWPGTTLRLLKFPILRPSDKRVYFRTQRIIAERSMKGSEEKLRQIQANVTKKIEHATLIGHIGKTFEHVPEDKIDPFSLRQGSGGTAPLLTLNEQDKDYVESKWCYDTPGVIHSEQIQDLLTTEELLVMLPKRMIQPRTFLIKPQMSLFIGGLGRLDYLTGDKSIRFTVYASQHLPITICDTEAADEVYETFVGSEIMGVPFGDEERMTKWKGLDSSDVLQVTGDGNNLSSCDILLSSAGWIGVNIPLNVQVELKGWTPLKRGIFLRKPSLIPFGVNLRGPRIRGTLAYKIGKPFV